MQDGEAVAQIPDEELRVGRGTTVDAVQICIIAVVVPPAALTARDALTGAAVSIQRAERLAEMVGHTVICRQAFSNARLLRSPSYKSLYYCEKRDPASVRISSGAVLDNTCFCIDCKNIKQLAQIK